MLSMLLRAALLCCLLRHATMPLMFAITLIDADMPRYCYYASRRRAISCALLPYFMLAGQFLPAAALFYVTMPTLFFAPMPLMPPRR